MTPIKNFFETWTTRIVKSFLVSVACGSMLALSSHAQPRPTDEADYNGTFQYAVSQTNSAYPVIFKVETERIVNGKSVRKEIETVENEGELRHRSKTIIVEVGKTRVLHEIVLGEGNGFCKEDGLPWKRSEFSCNPSVTVFGSSPTPDSVEYTVEDRKIDNKPVKVYRKYAVFAGRQTKSPKVFEEEISTIDANGYFLTVDKSFGTLGPRIVNRTMKQSWIVRAKIPPIVAPIK